MTQQSWRGFEGRNSSNDLVMIAQRAIFKLNAVFWVAKLTGFRIYGIPRLPSSFLKNPLNPASFWLTRPIVRQIYR